MAFGEVYDGDGCLGFRVGAASVGFGSGFNDIGGSASRERWTHNL